MALASMPTGTTTTIITSYSLRLVIKFGNAGTIAITTMILATILGEGAAVDAETWSATAPTMKAIVIINHGATATTAALPTIANGTIITMTKFFLSSISPATTTAAPVPPLGPILAASPAGPIMEMPIGGLLGDQPPPILILATQYAPTIGRTAIAISTQASISPPHPTRLTASSVTSPAVSALIIKAGRSALSALALQHYSPTMLYA